jgi:hypothetical protein
MCVSTQIGVCQPHNNYDSSDNTMNDPFRITELFLCADQSIRVLLLLNHHSGVVIFIIYTQFGYQQANVALAMLGAHVSL